MATIRQRLIDLVALQLAVPGLTGVHVWRVTPLAQEELPAATVRDTACESRIRGTQSHEHRLLVEVDIYGTDLIQVRELLGLVIATLRTNPKWFDGTQVLATHTEPKGDTLMTAQEERFLAGARLQFVIIYLTPFFDPVSVYP